MAEPNFTDEANFMGAACLAMMFALDNWQALLDWATAKGAPIQDPEAGLAEMRETIAVLDARYVMEVEGV